MSEQQVPTPNTEPTVISLVMKDLEDRDRIGQERYGTSLQPHNGRNSLWDAYEEILDLVMYIRQHIEEQK